MGISTRNIARRKNEKSLIGVIFLSIVLTSLIAVSCVATVSQEEYDKLGAELSAAQAQVEALQSDLESAQSRIALLEEKIAWAKAQAEIISGLFVPALTGELNEMTSAESIRYFLEWRDQVEANDRYVMKKLKIGRYLVEVQISSAYGC